MKASSRGLGVEALWAFAVRGLGAGAGFLMSLAIARALGAEQAGLYLLGLALITFISGLCRLGMDSALLRFISSYAAESNWGAVNCVFRQGTMAVLGVSTSAAASLWMLAPWLAGACFGKPELAPTLRAIAPGLVGLSLCFVLSFSLQALGHVTGAVFSQSLGIALAIVMLSPLLTDSVSAGHAYSLASIVTAAAAFFWWRRSHPSTTGSFPRGQLWASSLPLWIVMGTNSLQQWSGQFVAGAMVPANELARLAIAQRAALLISILLIAINLVVAPRFAALHKQGRIEDLRRVAQASVRIILVIVTPFIAVLLLVAGWVMSLFGPDFREGDNLLRILALGQFANAATGSVGTLLMMTGHEKDFRNIALIAGPLAVVLAFVLTPLFGVVGAATATSIGLVAQNILAEYMVRKRLGFSTMEIWQK